MFTFIFAIMLVLGAGLAQAALSDGVWAAMHLESDTSNEVANVTFGNSGFTFGAAKLTNGATAAQNTDLMTGDEVCPAGEKTVLMWFNATADGSTTYLYYSQSQWEFFEDLSGNDKFTCRMRDGGSVQKVAYADSTHTTGTWYFVGCMYNGSDFCVIVNGAAQGCVAVTSAGNCADDFDIGKSGSTPLGVYDEVVVWNRGLTPTELTALYNSGDGCEYPFVADCAGGAPAAADSLNISEFVSLNINYNQTSGSHFTADLRVNSTQNFSCDFMLDGIVNGTHAVNFTGMGLVDYNMSHKWDSYATDTQDQYVVTVQCNNSLDRTNTTNTTALVDRVLPTMTTNIINLSTNFSKTLTAQINGTDPFLYKINYSDTCNNTYSNTSVSSPESVNITFSILDCGLGSKRSRIEVCDGNSSALNCIIKTYDWIAKSSLRVRAFQHDGAAIANFSLYVNGSFIANSSSNYTDADNLQLGSYNVSFFSDGYERKDAIVNITSASQTYNFTNVYFRNTLNITFRDEADNATIALGNTISLDLISDIFSSNYTTVNSSLFLTLISPASYTMRYSAINYTERFWYFTLTNRTYNVLTLYLSSNLTGTRVTATVFDESGSKVEDAYIKVLKFQPSTNAYQIVEVTKTNWQGEAYMTVTLNDEFYKFIIEYPYGTQRLVTSPSYITSTSLTFQINLAGSIGTNYFNTMDVVHNLIFNNVTNNFRFFYNDANNLVSEGCLYVYTVNKYQETTYYNHTCGSGSSGTILLGVINETGKTYLAKSYVDFGSGLQYLRELYHTFNPIALSNSFGLFLILLLCITFAFMFIFDKTIALVITPLPMLIGSWVGLWSVPFSISLAVEIICIIIAIVVSNKSK